MNPSSELGLGVEETICQCYTGCPPIQSCEKLDGDVRTVDIISTFFEDLLAKEDCACRSVHEKVIFWHILSVTDMLSSIVS